MDEAAVRPIGRVVFLYTTWLVLLLVAGLLLIRGDELQLVGILPWGVAVFAALAGLDAMTDHHRRLGVSVAGLAFVVMGIYPAVALTVGAPSYQAALGQRGPAVVTEIEAVDAGLGEAYHRCRVALAATERDLGWIWQNQCGLGEPGDRIEVSYDPHGWVVPMAAQQLPAAHTGSMVMLAWLLATSGTAAAAVSVAAVD